MNPVLERVTERIRDRSAESRSRYLSRIGAAAEDGPSRSGLSCSNQAHAMAACSAGRKEALSGTEVPNIGIVSADNDRLSAHQPVETYPGKI